MEEEKAMTEEWITISEDDPATYPQKGKVCVFELPHATPCYLFDGVFTGARIQDDIHRRSFALRDVLRWRKKQMDSSAVDRRNERLLRRGW